MRQVTEIKESR